MQVELVANAVVAILLVVMIGYSFLLNRRLDGLRQGHQEMIRLTSSLNQASERAQNSIHELRTMGQEADHSLKLEVAKARSLADELSLITEAGADLADRLEQRFDRVKPVAGKSKPPAAEDWLLDEGTTAPGNLGNDLLSKLRSAR